MQRQIVKDHRAAAADGHGDNRPVADVLIGDAQAEAVAVIDVARGEVFAVAAGNQAQTAIFRRGVVERDPDRARAASSLG